MSHFWSPFDNKMGLSYLSFCFEVISAQCRHIASKVKLLSAQVISRFLKGKPEHWNLLSKTPQFWFYNPTHPWYLSTRCVIQILGISAMHIITTLRLHGADIFECYRYLIYQPSFREQRPLVAASVGTAFVASLQYLQWWRPLYRIHDHYDNPGNISRISVSWMLSVVVYILLYWRKAPFLAMLSGSFYSVKFQCLWTILSS